MDKKLNGWNDNKSPSSGIGGRPPYVERVAPNPQSEPLPDSGGNKAIQQLIKMIETRMSLVDSLDDATPSDRARYDVYVDMLAALKDASTVSEAGEDTIGFAEWVVSDNNPAPNKYNSDDDNNGKWCDAFSEGINRHYYTTEQLYKIYRKQ